MYLQIGFFIHDGKEIKFHGYPRLIFIGAFGKRCYPTFYFTRAGNNNIDIYSCTTLPLTVTYIKQNPAFVTFRKCILLESNAFCGCKFGFNIIIFQQNRIVTRGCLLVGPVKTGTGWNEYWVGFRGIQIDHRVEKRFFIKEEPLHQIGLSATIVSLYEDILKLSAQEKSGYQQIVSSIVLHILGLVYYKEKNNSFTNTYVIDKINEARILMKENIELPLSPEKIADRLGLGYSWFRRMFKEYTGVSPAQYQMQQKLLRAKELLTSSDKNISEIAYMLNFENADQFSTFFRKKEGVTPSYFRERAH